jgi:serine protease inhibitor
MAYAGAQGSTATQMAAALQFGADAGTSIFDGQNALSQALASRGPAELTAAEQAGTPDASATDYELQVVNSVWGDQSYTWAALPQTAVDNSTRLVLVNAIHLKFPWATPFIEALTAPGSFTRQDATTVSASFMKETATLSYEDDGQAQIVSVPLSGGQVSVVIALPHPDVTLATYEAALHAGSAALAPPPSASLVALSLPKATFISPSFSRRTVSAPG